MRALMGKGHTDSDTETLRTAGCGTITLIAIVTTLSTHRVVPMALCMMRSALTVGTAVIEVICSGFARSLRQAAAKPARSQVRQWRRKSP